LADFFADLDDDGGGVLSIFRRPFSKLNPLDLMAIAFTIKIVIESFQKFNAQKTSRQIKSYSQAKRLGCEQVQPSDFQDSFRLKIKVALKSLVCYLSLTPKSA
jgi:hypothetical protein